MHVQYILQVPGEVFNLTVNATLTSFTLSWRPPLEANGIVIQYEICFNYGEVFVYSNTSDTNYSVTNFPPDTYVTFNVRAYTIIGSGEFMTVKDSTDSIRK